MIGVTYASHNIWWLVATIVINASIATVILTTYTVWWIRNRFGKVHMRVNVNGHKKNMHITYTQPKMSLAQMALTHA
jgi:predicted secreted Zn-dependent protease